MPTIIPRLRMPLRGRSFGSWWTMKKLLKILGLSPVLAVLIALSQPLAADADAPYTISAGDVLQISVWKEEQLDQEVLVLADGTINFPLIGSVPAQGQTPAELQSAIKDKLSKFIPDAAVTVAVKAALGHTVSVIGQVAKPGELVMGHGLTV